MKTQTVSIIGLDRISGSIGLVLKSGNRSLTIAGYDQDRGVVKAAKKAGIIDRAGPSLVKTASVGDIVILTADLSELEEIIQAIGSVIQEHTLIVDLSSLKGPGLGLAKSHLENGHYVSASPVLAEASLVDSRFGIEAARVDLFHRSVFCIMPSPQADPQAVETTVNLGRILGSTPFFLDAHEYDGLIHGVKTTPGLLAAAMFRAISKATGWRDMLRFAGLPFALSTAALETRDLSQLALRDKDASLRWLDAVLDELQEVRRWIADADEERLDLLLEDLVFERDRWLNERKENNWNEIEAMPDTSVFNIGSQLFGFRGTQKDKDSKGRK
jgi:prephenate dehydrogenase